MQNRINKVWALSVLLVLTQVCGVVQAAKKVSSGNRKPKQPQYISVTQAEYALMEQKKKDRAAAERKKMLDDQYDAREDEEYSEIEQNLNPAPPSYASTRLNARQLGDQSDHPTFILNIEPIWMFVYGFGAKAEYAITDTISIGVSGAYVREHESEFADDEDYNWEYQEYNLGTNIMLTGKLNTNGFYINPAIGYFSAKITDYGDYYYQGELESPQLRVTAGYQIVYSSFRLGLGVGGRIYDTSDIVIEDSQGREAYTEKSTEWGALAADFHIGYVF